MQSLLYGLFSESPWNRESAQIPYKIINDSLLAKLTCFPLNYILILRFNVTAVLLVSLSLSKSITFSKEGRG